MRWIVTPNGERAHAIVGGFTLCGIRESIGTDATANAERCKNCDKEWRRRGRETRRKRGTREIRNEAYRPKHTFKDWDR